MVGTSVPAYLWERIVNKTRRGANGIWNHDLYGFHSQSRSVRDNVFAILIRRISNDWISRVQLGIFFSGGSRNICIVWNCILSGREGIRSFA